MKKLALTLIAMSSLLTACGQSSLPVQNAQMPLQAQSVQQNREILVKFKGQMQQTDLHSFNAKFGLHTVQTLPSLNVQVMRIDDTVALPMQKVLHYIQADQRVEYAEVNGKMKVNPEYQMKISPIY